MPENKNENVELNEDSTNGKNEENPSDDLKTKIQELLKLENNELELKVKEIKEVEARVMEISEKVLKASKEQNERIKTILEKLENNSNTRTNNKTLEDFVH